MHDYLKSKYKDIISKLTSSLKSGDTVKIELAKLFISIADEIVAMNSSSSQNLEYYNDAAIHYTHAINISKKLIDSLKGAAVTDFIPISESIIRESETKLKSLHSIIVEQISADSTKVIADEILSLGLDEISNKFSIFYLRDHVKIRLQEMHRYYIGVCDPAAYIAESTAIFEEIAGGMKGYFASVASSSSLIVGEAPCKYTVMGLGSMALRQITPYSDLEFAILTENDDYKASSDPKVRNYFKNLSHYINFKVICLGETTIANSMYGLNNLDDLGRRGINFDLGGKTSLGRTDKDYDLVCTVEQMLRYLRGDYVVTDERRRDDKLEHILENTCYICGNDGEYETSLLKEYQERAREYLTSVSSEVGYTNFFSRGVEVLAGDIKEDQETIAIHSMRRVGDLSRFQFDAYGHEGKIFDVKQEIYRLPDRLIYNFGLIYGLTAVQRGLSGIEIIDGLLSRGIINPEAAAHLKETVTYANMLRVRTYDFYGQQQESMDIMKDTTSVAEVDNFRLNPTEIAEDAALFRYYYSSLTLHKILEEFCKKIKSQEAPLTADQISNFFASNLFYEPTNANKAQVYMRLCIYDKVLQYNLIQLDELNGNGPTTNVTHSTADMTIIYENLGHIYTKMGDYKNAITFYQRILPLVSENPDQQLKHAATLSNIGHCLVELGDYRNAFSIIHASLKIQQTSPSTPNLLITMNNFAFVLSKMGFDDGALDTYKKIIEKYLDIGEKCDVERALIMNNIGLIKYNKGSYSEALEYYQESITILVKIFSNSHQNIAYILDSIGVVHSSMGQYDEAIPIHIKSMLIKEKIFGQNHYKLAANYSNLGTVYLNKKDYVQALAYIKQSSKILTQQVGEESDRIVVNYSNIGKIYEDLGKINKALKYFNKSLQVAVQIFGEESNEVMNRLVMHAEFFLRQNDTRSAISHLVKSAYIAQKIGFSIPKRAEEAISGAIGALQPVLIKLFIQSDKSTQDYHAAIDLTKQLLGFKKALYGEDSEQVLKFTHYVNNQYTKLTAKQKETTWAEEWVDLMSFGLKRPLTNFVEVPEHDSTDRSMRIVSYNIGVDFFDDKDVTTDGRHHWSFRAPFVKQLLGTISADIMCLQELSPAQALELAAIFAGRFESIFLSQTPSEVEPAGSIIYGEEVSGWAGKRLGTPLIGIFVNKSTNYVIAREETGRFWLNETPDEVPTAYDRDETDKGFGNMNTYRAVLWCKVINLTNGDPIYIFNSHYPLSGNSETRFKCAELERAKIEEITARAKWVSASDRNLIKCDDDNPYFNPQTIYKKLTQNAHDIRDHRPDKHYGISSTWLGFHYDEHRGQISKEPMDVLDVMVSSMNPICSFFHPGVFNPADGSIIPLASYNDSALLASYNESRYFASDHALIGADLSFE